MVVCQYPRYFAHRGASRYACENTLTALRLAAQLGARWVECDVRLTADNKLVVFHDATLLRLANINKSISACNLQTIQSIHIQSAATDALERIPALNAFLTLAKSLGVAINIEIKPEKKRESACVSAVLAAIAESHFDVKHLLCSSSCWRTLCLMRHHCLEMPLAFVARYWWGVHWRRCDLLNCQAIHLHVTQWNKRRIAKTHARGLLAAAYTVNDAHLAQTFFAAGGDAVFSDDPRMAQLW